MNSITYEGLFEGKLKDRLILRQKTLEELTSLFTQAIPPEDEGVLEITRINLATGRTTVIKKILFLNELYLNEEEPKELLIGNFRESLNLYRLRWSKR